MRPPISAMAVCLTLVPIVGAVVAADQPRPAPAAPSPASASQSDNEAAARHARLTACLKEAKSKKLVGPQKTAYLKGCMAAP